MKKYRKNLILALVCFLIVIVLNFFLPRLLPGNPIAYLTGFSEEDMTPAQVAYYRQALHLDKPVFVQFGCPYVGIAFEILRLHHHAFFGKIFKIARFVQNEIAAFSPRILTRGAEKIILSVVYQHKRIAYVKI